MSDHVHRWQLQPPNGTTSTGACACGETRTFFNTFDDAGPSAKLQRVLKREKLALAEPYRLIGNNKGITR